MSKKHVTIAGTGMGSAGSMTCALRDAVRRAELIIGARRVAEGFQQDGNRVVFEYRPGRIREIVEGAEESEILVLVTGDQGFYSASGGIRQALADFHPEVLPGISSVSYFSAATGVPYSDACLASAHGRALNIVSAVRRHPMTFVLSGGNVGSMLHTLCEYGYGGLEVYTGENLSYKNERILHGTAEELSGEAFDPLSLMVVLNPRAEERVPVGIPDDAFVRGKVPMTKRAVRAFIISSLEIRADSVICDIGAGTGSVSIEAALAAYDGTVYSIEKNPDAVELIRRNAVKFHTDNIQIVPGAAPEAMKELPEADAYFIGGSSGNLGGILEYIKNTSGPGEKRKKVVASAATVQTLAEASTVLEKMQAERISYVQIQSSHSHRAGRYDMMKAENPVCVITAEI